MDTVLTDETFGYASFSVISSRRTQMPFTVIVETFDLTPAEARG